MTRHPAALAGLAATLAACVALGWFLPREAPGPSPRDDSSRTLAVVSGPASSPAADLLRDWDARRAAAYASGDVRALRGLYVDGSPAATADERVLRGYTRRGLRVVGMRMQLLALDVLDRSPGRLRLRVTDRLAGATVLDAGERRSLPRDRASTRVVELRRGADDVWRVRSVSR